MSRYKNTPTFINNLELYKEARKKRGIPLALTQFRLNRLPKPTASQIRDINSIGHIWKTGDRLFKLAQQYYDDPNLWWVIAWYNKKPTESHFQVGDVIQIPTPLERVYGLMRM